MITLIVSITILIVYITIIFCRGIYREKKDQKLRQNKDDSLDEEENQTA